MIKGMGRCIYRNHGMEYFLDLALKYPKGKFNKIVKINSATRVNDEFMGLRYQ